jgi:hypothetical protein
MGYPHRSVRLPLHLENLLILLLSASSIIDPSIHRLHTLRPRYLHSDPNPSRVLRYWASRSCRPDASAVDDTDDVTAAVVVQTSDIQEAAVFLVVDA